MSLFSLATATHEEERDGGDQFHRGDVPQEIILMGVRWYLACLLRTRHVEELTDERGAELDHTTINRWVIKYSPLLRDTVR